MDKFPLEKELNEWFIPKKEYMEAFADADSRVESWFKGESIVLFQRLKDQQKINHYHREHPVFNSREKKNNKADFILDINGHEILVEYKALCISQADNTPRNLNFYFQDNDVGMVKDFTKFETVQFTGQMWVVGFVYPNPGFYEWERITNQMYQNHSLWVCSSNPTDFPDYLYIAYWLKRLK